MPGRTLGMTKYLSRHPSPYERSIVKSEQTFIDWLTIKVVNKFEKALNGAMVSKCKRPIKCEKAACSQPKAKNSVLTVVKASAVDEMSIRTVCTITTNYSFESIQNASESRISKNYFRANCEEDGHYTKMIELVKTKDSAQLARLPAPWREILTSLNLDSNTLL